MAKKRAKKVAKKSISRPAKKTSLRGKPKLPSTSERKIVLKYQTAWSHSAWSTWRECPRRYFHKSVERVWDPEQRKYVPVYQDKPNRAMERGIEIHLLMEHYLKGDVRGVPNQLKNIETELRNMRRLGAVPEESWTLTNKLERCEATDWDRAWLRAKIDAHLFFENDAELVIVDLKTGRIKPYESQKELYAWMGSIIVPEAEHIRVELLYSDHEADGRTNPDISYYTKKDAKRLGKKWIERGNRMLADREYPMKPGSACDRCSFRSNIKMPDGRPGPCDGWKQA